MRALADAAKRRADHRLSEDWDRLAEGSLSADEREALAAEDPDGVFAELFEPLDRDFQRRIVGDLVRRRQDEATLDPLDEASPPPRISEGAGPQQVAPANVRRPWAWMAAGAALVAAVLLAVSVTLAVQGPAATPQSYTFEVSSGDAVVRGAGDPAQDVRVLTVGTRLEIVARPGTEGGATDAGVSFELLDGSRRPSPVRPDLAPTGAVRWVGVAGEDGLNADVRAVELSVRDGADRSHATRVPVRVEP